jgi:phosphoribosylanthranilate isomerase
MASLGGTGETHDWAISRQIVERCPLPVFLAGGLSSANVEEAIRTVKPFGVDVCSSLRPEGTLHAGLLHDFVFRANCTAA